MNRLIFINLLSLFSCLFFASICTATPELAQQTGFACAECHMDPAGGGPLTEKGRNYLEQGKLHYKPLSPVQKIVRLFIGYFHIMAAITWFGAIIYVHLLLKPAYAAKGLPRGELFLGWISMIIILITGILLTIARIPAWKTFYTSRFGILLGIKILLFAIMFLSALIVTVFIGPRLRKQRKAAGESTTGMYSPDALAGFDGKEGNPAYIAYKGLVYDVSQSRLWKGGSHLRKHNAGQDLTAILKTAPHGEEKVLAMPKAGALLPAAVKPPAPFHERLFYFFAFMNLVLTFVIVFIIALWRWW
ncbi:MAG: CopD family protein [Dissulfurispiraceae bacterium]|jgi:predicted heme/steroid binding protein